MVNIFDQSIERRFWGNVDKSYSARGCWLWTASFTGKTHKYGQISVRGHIWKAHRLAYLLHNGEIPTGLHVRHTCDNPSCVNPDHLLAGTHQDNMRDAVERGRFFVERHNIRTHCYKGHLFTPETVYISKGNRRCKICLSVWQKQNYRAKHSIVSMSMSS
jgi:hypothetical protein